MITYIKRKYFWPIALLIFFSNIFYTNLTLDKFDEKGSMIFLEMDNLGKEGLTKESRSRTTNNGVFFKREFKNTIGQEKMKELIKSKFAENEWMLISESNKSIVILRYRLPDGWTSEVRIDEKEYIIQIEY